MLAFSVGWYSDFLPVRFISISFALVMAKGVRWGGILMKIPPTTHFDFTLEAASAGPGYRDCFCVLFSIVLVNAQLTCAYLWS